MSDVWTVQIKGDEPEDMDGDTYGNVEVSVVHRDNDHGQASWGWADQHKIIFTTDYDVDVAELSRLKGCAQAVADHLNTKEV